MTAEVVDGSLKLPTEDEIQTIVEGVDGGGGGGAQGSTRKSNSARGRRAKTRVISDRDWVAYQRWQAVKELQEQEEKEKCQRQHRQGGGGGSGMWEEEGKCEPHLTAVPESWQFGSIDLQMVDCLPLDLVSSGYSLGEDTSFPAKLYFRDVAGRCPKTLDLQVSQRDVMALREGSDCKLQDLLHSMDNGQYLVEESPTCCNFRESPVYKHPLKKVADLSAWDGDTYVAQLRKGLITNTSFRYDGLAEEGVWCPGSSLAGLGKVYALPSCRPSTFYKIQKEVSSELPVKRVLFQDEEDTTTDDGDKTDDVEEDDDEGGKPAAAAAKSRRRRALGRLKRRRSLRSNINTKGGWVEESTDQGELVAEIFDWARKVYKRADPLTVISEGVEYLKRCNPSNKKFLVKFLDDFRRSLR